MNAELLDSGDLNLIENNNNFLINPIWLRERIEGDQFIDSDTHQRLYEPSSINLNLSISSAQIDNNLLNVKFSDGIQATYNIDLLMDEFNEQKIKKGPLPEIKLWNSQMSSKPEISFSKGMEETKSMYDLLNLFYTYGFVIIKNTPTKEKFLVEFVNLIGPIRVTNFGEYFDVMSKPNPNDLAYKPIALPPHTDNPYRKPVPGIQFLHCLKNEVSGGFSTLVDGFAVAEHIKNNNPQAFESLTQTKVRFHFEDDTIVLENWGELIELDEFNNYKQVRYSTRVDYVQPLDDKKLKNFYSARKYLSELYSSSEFELKFKLQPGDIMMFDNHRLLHGRTAYDSNEGARHLQGCYLDFDATDGKLRHLHRKFS